MSPIDTQRRTRTQAPALIRQGDSFVLGGETLYPDELRRIIS